MGLDVGYYLAEFVERLGCLRIQADVFVHVQFADFFQLLDDDGFAFGLEAAAPIKQASLALGIDPLYAMLPSYGIIMGGGALINLSYCFIRLAIKPELSVRADLSQPARSLLINGALAAAGGIMLYLQFFFYAWGEASIPEHLSFVNWMLHMSGYVLCGGIVGLLLAEWKGVGSRPVRILCIGMLVIVAAANLVGMGMA